MHLYPANPDEGSYTPEERESYIEIILSNTGESSELSVVPPEGAIAPVRTEKCPQPC